jgi:hypothetical protein
MILAGIFSFLSSLLFFSQAKDAQSSDNVFPVPVGLSSSAFFSSDAAVITNLLKS